MDTPERIDDEGFDVVLLHGATDDGQGVKVLRARSGRVEAGEVRPLREGRPLAAGGEVVRLAPRKDAPALFDVHVEHVVSAAPGPSHEPASAPERREREGHAALSGPAQVANRAYRDSWERTFGARKALN